MKKKLLGLFFLFISFTSCALNYFDVENIEGGVRISKCNTQIETNFVPEEIGGKSVLELGTNSFSERLFLNELILPQSLTKICDKAFYECKKLYYIDFKDCIDVSIDSFINCPKIENIVIKKDFKINPFKSNNILNVYFYEKKDINLSDYEFINENTNVYYYSEERKEGYWHFKDGLAKEWN
jgi:hypothetical protein